MKPESRESPGGRSVLGDESRRQEVTWTCSSRAGGRALTPSGRQVECSVSGIQTATRHGGLDQSLHGSLKGPRSLWAPGLWPWGAFICLLLLCLLFPPRTSLCLEFSSFVFTRRSSSFHVFIISGPLRSRFTNWSKRKWKFFFLNLPSGPHESPRPPVRLQRSSCPPAARHEAKLTLS